MFSEQDFPAFGKHISRRQVIDTVGLGIGGAIAKQQQQQASKQASKASLQKADGGTGGLEQRKTDGMGRRMRQSKRREVAGVGLGTDSSVDKGAGRKQVQFEGLHLKHDFGCIDKCCSHGVGFDDVVLKQDVDVKVVVEESCTTHASSSSSVAVLAQAMSLQTDLHVRRQIACGGFGSAVAGRGQ